MPHLLLVDDDPEALEWLTELAKAEGFTVASADSLRSARIHMTRLQPDIMMTDLHLPDGKGIDLVSDLETRESTEVVLITGHASVETAVEALRLGATDYLIKPLDVERLKAILRRVPRTGELRAEIGELRDELRRLGRFGRILGSSAPMQKLYDQIGRVAPTEATVLLMRRERHRQGARGADHPRAERGARSAPFLPLNCGAISPQLIESELFGHEKGSFTGADRQHKGYFERANGGTLFLDEITEMPQELQVKLLRVLETGSFMRVGTTQPISADVRMIAATNRDPEAGGGRRQAARGPLLPPERVPDPHAAAARARHRHRAARAALPRGAEQAGERVQVLRAGDHRRAVRAQLAGQRARAEELRAARVHPGRRSDRRRPRAGHGGRARVGAVLTVRVGTTLDEVSRRLIEATLAECGSKRKAADMLGISLKTLYNRLAAYKADPGGDEEVDERRRAA